MSGLDEGGVFQTTLFECRTEGCTVRGRALTLTQARLHAEYANHPVWLMNSRLTGASPSKK